MATLKQIQANRRNAKKSCGPKSSETKVIVSQNRLDHGLCAKFRVLACEDQAEYDDLFRRFMEAEKPGDDVERELVAKMALHSWQSDRAQRLQDGCFLIFPSTPELEADRQDEIAVRKDLHKYLRYQAHHNREYERASRELRQRRKERLKAEIGFESKKRVEADREHRAEIHTYRVERYKTAVAIDKTRLEREQTKTFVQAAAAAKHFDGFPPPQIDKIAA